jgi:hypothetical protein
MGKWKPTEVGSDCGKGQTELERKLIVKIPPKKNEDDKGKVSVKDEETDKENNTHHKSSSDHLNPLPNKDQPKTHETHSKLNENEKISNNFCGYLLRYGSKIFNRHMNNSYFICFLSVGSRINNYPFTSRRSAY